MVSLTGGAFIALAWAIAALVEQKVTTSVPEFGTVLVPRATVTLLTAIPLALVVALSIKQPLFSHQPATWGWSIVSQLCTLAGAVTNLWLLRRYSVATVIVVSGLYPVVAACLATWLGQEKLVWYQYVGLLFIALGLICFFVGPKTAN